MDSTEMIFRLPEFEIKNFYENEWNKISEKDFLLMLLENFTTITPVLSKMFQGEKIVTPDCMYRIQRFSY